MNFTKTIGLGVAGNFAHHLEQAGELKDFENVVTKEENAPKGIFPFYLPNFETFLGVYPISHEKLELPSYEANAQVEPEVAILFDIIYNEKNEVQNSLQHLMIVRFEKRVQKRFLRKSLGLQTLKEWQRSG